MTHIAKHQATAARGPRELLVGDGYLRLAVSTQPSCQAAPQAL